MVNGATCFAWSMVGFAAVAFAAPWCGDSVPSTPQATVIDSLVGPGDAGSAACPLASGTNWADMTKTKDGDTYNNAGVAVSCRVAGNENDGFDVDASVALTGKGTITVKGHFTTASTPQSGITAAFLSSQGFGPFNATDCVVTYPAPPAIGGIASGRAAFHIECPTLVDQQHSKTCKGSATLIFENCAQ